LRFLNLLESCVDGEERKSGSDFRRRAVESNAWRFEAAGDKSEDTAEKFIEKDTQELLYLLESAGKQTGQADFFKLKGELNWDLDRSESLDDAAASLFSLDLGGLHQAMKEQTFASLLDIQDPLFLELESRGTLFAESVSRATPAEKAGTATRKAAQESKETTEDLRLLEQLMKGTSVSTPSTTKQPEARSALPPAKAPVPSVAPQAVPIAAAVAAVVNDGEHEDLEANLDDILEL